MKPPTAPRAVPELTTARLRLRGFRPEDAPAFHAAYGDAQSMRYWNHGPSRDIARTERYIRGWMKVAPDGWMVWAVTRLDDDRCLGMVNFHGRSTGNRRAEIGYILTPDATGQGYATEAMAALIAHLRGVLNVHRIEAEIEPGNTASRRLVERLGFTLEAALLRDRLRVGNAYLDMTLYALVGP